MSNIKIEIKWGFIFIAMSLLWMLLEKLAGLHDERISSHATLTGLIAIPAIAIYVFALLEKKRKFYGGVMTFRQGFISGLIITLIVTVFSPLTQYITLTFITPDYFKNVIEYSVASEILSREQAEANFNLKSYIFQGLIGAPVMGLITSAVVAFFVRSRKKAV